MIGNEGVAMEMENDNGSKRKIGVLVAILFVLAVIVVVVLILVNRRDAAQVKGASEIRVSITEDGFTPSTITVTQGAKVIWVNDTAAPHQVGADPYPEATSLPGLKSSVIAPGESYAYTFKGTGIFNYADYTNPLTNGSVQVK